MLHSQCWFIFHYNLTQEGSQALRTPQYGTVDETKLINSQDLVTILVGPR